MLARVFRGSLAMSASAVTSGASATTRSSASLAWTTRPTRRSTRAARRPRRSVTIVGRRRSARAAPRTSIVTTTSTAQPTRATTVSVRDRFCPRVPNAQKGSASARACQRAACRASTTKPWASTPAARRLCPSAMLPSLRPCASSVWLQQTATTTTNARPTLAKTSSAAPKP